MLVLFNVWTDAKTEEKALKVIDKVIVPIDAQADAVILKPYPKTGGYMACFTAALKSEAWNDAVIEAIELGQRVGYDWQLTGNILDDPGGWSNKAKISGVQSISWHITRNTSKEQIDALMSKIRRKYEL